MLLAALIIYCSARESNKILVCGVIAQINIIYIEICVNAQNSILTHSY